MSPSTPERPDDHGRGFADVAVQNRLIELSQSFLYHALDGDACACAGLFADDGLWFGPMSSKAPCAVEEFRRFCDAIYDRGFRVILSHLTLTAFPQRNPALCTVSARCFIYVGIGGQGTPIVSRPLRVDFLWKQIEGGAVRIASLAAGFLLESQGLEDGGGAQDDIVHDAEAWEGRLEVRDRDGRARFIDENEITYLEAAGRRTIIHCLGDEIIAQASIGELSAQLNDRFVRLHRTYLVNGWYVKSIAAEGAVMADGAVLPVPSRRLVALRTAINAVKKPSRLSLPDLERAVKAAMSSTDDAPSQR